MQRTWRRPVAFGAAVALLLSSCSFDKDESPESNGTVEVTTEGGSFTVEGITVNVAPQTVRTATKLTVSTPVVQKGNTSRPLGGANSTSVKFDVSLAGGVQPLQPLDVRIPLNGAFLPEGVKAEHALMYTPSGTGDWRLVPSVVTNGVLHAKLAHLSEKQVTFFDSAADFWDDINPWKPKEVTNCNREITGATTGKVTLGGEGWKKDTGSVLHPCLVQEDGKVSLRVGNNTGIMWSVASNGPGVNSPDGNVDADMIKLIAKTLAPNSKVKAYLAEGDATWTKIQQSDLPVTLEFKADPSTFLAQALWVGLNMSVGMFTGTSGDKTITHVKNLLGIADVIGCLNNAAETATGNFDANKVIDIVLSTCGELIAKSLSVDVKSGESKDWVFGGILAALAGIKDSVLLLGTAFQGVMQQVNGNVTVKVMRAAPPCATRKNFNDASSRARGVRVNANITQIVCDGGWAYGYETSEFDTSLVIVRLKNGDWEQVYSGSDQPELEFDPFCSARSTPKTIRNMCRS